MVFSRSQLADAAQREAAQEHLNRALAACKCSRTFRPGELLTKPWDEWGSEDFAAIDRCGCRQTSCEKFHFDEHRAFGSAYFLELGLSCQQLEQNIPALFTDPACGHVLRAKGGETGGLIFANYRIEEFDTDMSRFDAMAIGQDFGFNHANAILTLGYKDGDIYVCNELYVHEMDTTEIIQKADGKFSKSLAMWCDSAEPDRIKMWRKAGYRARAVVKNPNSIQSQIDWLKGRKIHIHPSCVNVIKEIQQWRWRVDEKSGEYTDEPVNVFDDAMAALRYGVESWRKDKKAKIYSREEYGI